MSAYYSTFLKDYDVENLTFGAPQLKTPKSVPKYCTIPILSKDPQGLKSGNKKILFVLPEFFSYGVKIGVGKKEESDEKDKNEKVEKPKPEDQNSAKNLSLVLWDRDGATEDQLIVTEKLDQIVERIKSEFARVNSLDDARKLTGNKFSDSAVNVRLEKMDKFIYRKLDDKNEVVPNTSPNMTVKLIEKKNYSRAGILLDTTCNTIFRLKDTDEIVDPMNYLNTKIRITPIIIFESLFTNSSFTSIQCKISEAYIQVNSGDSDPIPRVDLLSLGSSSPKETGHSDSDKEDVDEYADTE